MLDKSQKVHLGNNKGISIFCEPSSGVLNKKQSNKILISLFNDTSGVFKDNLIIDVKNHEKKVIPMEIQIKGTPVCLSRNQVGINFKDEIPVMNFGRLPISSEVVKKRVKVVNNGPKDLSLRWVIYPYGKVDKEKDIFKI